MFRAGLHLDTGAYASYGLNPTPQSPIGSECVDVKGEISHPTLNMLLKLGYIVVVLVVVVHMYFLILANINI